MRARTGDPHPGLLFEERRWTWGEVVEEALVRAAAIDQLAPAPPGRHSHIGILLDNVPEYVFWLAGGALAGATVVGVNSSRSAAELAADVRHADVDLVVTESRLAHLLDGQSHGVPHERIVDIDDPAYRALVERAGEALDADAWSPAPDDTALLLFSSGSTGVPKAVIVSQGRLAGLADAIVERIGLRRDSVTYLAMPLFHGNAIMMNLVPAMAVGATVGMTRKFSASRFSEDVHRFGATYANYVGRALSYILATPADPRDSSSTLELAYGTEASETDIVRFAERYGCRVQEGYGLSEGVFRINRTAETPPGSLGKPVGDADVRILDESTGAECPRARFDDQGKLLNPEAVGQIVARGLAHAFEGYYRNPAAMAERVRGADFWSGDLGYRDEDGWFYFAGRSADWLRVDSENFAAAQVERILVRFRGVASAPVYAVPDPRTGDRVMCALELELDVRFDPDEFGTFLEAQHDMGQKWWPSFVRLVDRVPLTGSNKVDKRPLRLDAWATGDPVFVRVGRTSSYVELDDERRRELSAEFHAHGRSHLLPDR